MIPSSAALPVVFGEPLLVLRLERRRVAGRAPPSEQRSEGQRGYSEGSRPHLHPHPALITVTLPTDIRVTAILVTVIRPMDIGPTHNPAMDTQVIPVLPVTLVPRAMDTMVTGDTQLTPVPRPINTTVTRDTRRIRQTTSTKVTEHTRPILAPPAMESRGTGRTPRCRRLQVMNTRTRRRLPLIPFLLIDHRRPFSVCASLREGSTVAC
jgi:hypothetical protein